MLSCPKNYIFIKSCKMQSTRRYSYQNTFPLHQLLVFCESMLNIKCFLTTRCHLSRRSLDTNELALPMQSTFVQSTRMQIYSKTNWTLSCWYSLEGSRRVLSDDYQCARYSVIFQFFFNHFVLGKLASSIRDDPFNAKATFFQSTRMQWFLKTI